MVRRVAELTGMRFFSSEIAMTEPGRFVLIDYVNDQCHMLSQGANPRMGVPNAVVAEIAGRLVDAAAELMSRREERQKTECCCACAGGCCVSRGR
jgi:hypothetical protein